MTPVVESWWNLGYDGTGVNAMSKELDEKREDLKGLIESKRQLETTLQQNKKGLSDALPYDLAVDLYKTGRMSENDFLAYKNGYEAWSNRKGKSGERSLGETKKLKLR